MLADFSGEMHQSIANGFKDIVLNFDLFHKGLTWNGQTITFYFKNCLRKLFIRRMTLISLQCPSDIMSLSCAIKGEVLDFDPPLLLSHIDWEGVSEMHLKSTTSIDHYSRLKWCQWADLQIRLKCFKLRSLPPSHTLLRKVCV